MTFIEMIRARKALEAADLDIFCFEILGTCYAVTLNEIPDSWVKQSRTSSKRGGMLKARIRPSAAEKQALLQNAACRVLGTLEELDAAYRAAYTRARGKDAPNNRGWMYECAVTERWGGQTWEPDSVPFWMAPDVTIDGIGYQVKGDQAEFFTEQCLQEAMQAAGM